MSFSARRGSPSRTRRTGPRRGSPFRPRRSPSTSSTSPATSSSPRRGSSGSAQQNPNLVSRITFSRAPSPELPAKLKAQQDANRVDIDLVLTGPGALSDGITQGLWIDVWTKHPGALPKPEEVYHEQALMMQKNFGKDQGVAVVYSPSGPLFEYAPERVKNRPKTTADLLAWVKANPNRFTYARPVNSGPGWTFLMGLPYILGDRDPKDPVNGWDKTWALSQGDWTRASTTIPPERRRP